MKSEFKAKFLQHMVQRRNSESGFTLIELLVVIIIIGILAAIALPSFLNQAAKAKQSEAKTYVGSVNRAQQSYRIEKTAFAADLGTLEIGVPTQTLDYSYEIAKGADAKSVVFNATPTDTNTLKAYAGGVMAIAVTGQSSVAACQTTSPSAAPPAITFASPGGASCATADNNMR